MPTSPRRGLNPARKVGSNPGTNALSAYTIASGYATALGVGDPVALTSDGTIIRAANGSDAIGVFKGVQYVNSQGEVKFDKYWAPSTVATQIQALVMEDPMQTYIAVADGPIPAVNVFPGRIYAMNLTTPSASTGRSQMTVATTPVRTGSLAVTGTNNAALTGLANNDTFQIRSTVANVNTTITIVTNQTPAQLLALLNAVPGISAELTTPDNFLRVRTTDGGNIVLTDGTGTPLTDSNLIGAAGTVTAVVAANAGMVKVVRVRDIDTRELEVVLVNHSLRDDG